MSSLPLPAGAGAASDAPAAVRIARDCHAVALSDLRADVIAKVKVCLKDLVGCAFESRDLPWAHQARGLAITVSGAGASIIGSPLNVSGGDAAFANAVMGHGLVREDMHSGSISHLGIVVLPTVLALAETRAVSGAEFVAAIVAGYEVGGQIGRACLDAGVARIHRPTGVTGPIAAAAAGSRLRRLDPDRFAAAVALGANTTLGFNQWAYTGGSEMFFQAGFAARNAVACVGLAELGAFASPTAIDGEAGLFAALGKTDGGPKVRPFAADPEILSVYHKPVPACNFAQTACLAAARIARETQCSPEAISAIRIRVPRAGKLYPGCDSTGPFDHVLQGKMSIQFNVAAALVERGVSEKNFTLLRDPRVARLLALTTLEVDDGMTRAYPGLQGGEVEIRTADGETHGVRLDDVVNATDDEVSQRFREAVREGLGAARAEAVEAFIDGIEHCRDAGELGRLLRADGA
ncbi:MAG: MmgE/PrpD family protein [Betaproteobacteria bacterium]|nr:MmgE/PrpD family protein [Betaproteobacteria bacterium]